ncbi:MAG: universal stress protein [Desulfobacteraceae bacterium]|nr:universal stress protein [Desulfobacteraceae bacterium]
MRKTYKSILCAIDFSEFSEFILHYGIVLAEEFNAVLYICHVVDIRSAAMYGDAVLDWEQQERRVQQYVSDKMASLMGAETIGWEPIIVFGRPANEIAKIVNREKIDLVITATHGRSGLKRIVLGSVTESLMRALECPMLVVKNREARTAGVLKRKGIFKRILIGCDFSEDSGLAFDYGLSLSQEFQSNVHLVHVVESTDYKDMIELEKLDIATDNGGIRQALKTRLLDMVPGEAGDWCSFTSVLLEGKPYDELSQFARDENIDLVVLGVRGRSVMETLFLGSTADRMVRKASCPILLIRQKRKEKPKKSATSRTRAAESGQQINTNKGSFFSVRIEENIAVLKFTQNLLLHGTDLTARESLFNRLDRISEDHSIKSLVIIGSDCKTGRDEYVDFFGHILNSKLDANSIHRLLNSVDQFLLKMQAYDKIVVHADCGPVISLYLNISLACDFRIIADNCMFYNEYLDLGMIPKGGGPYFLRRMIGSAKAYRYLMTTTECTAQEALEFGLVDAVVPSDLLENSAVSFAAQFSGRAADALSGMKRLIRNDHKELKQYLEKENEEILKVIGSPLRHSEFWKNIKKCNCPP